MGPQHKRVYARLRRAMREDDPSRVRWVRFAKMRGDRACTSSHDVKQPISFPRRMSAPGVCNFASPTRIEGWAERRETFGCSAEHPWGVSCASKTRVNALMTRYARRLRGALRPMTRDARLSALHRGGFGLPGPRFRLLRRPPSYNGGQLPCGSVQRAPRTQVVVPGGRGPCLPRRTVTSRRRRTPLPAPPSGSSPETPLDERGWEAM